jgi:hypothetical protein
MLLMSTSQSLFLSPWLSPSAQAWLQGSAASVSVNPAPPAVSPSPSAGKEETLCGEIIIRNHVEQK